MTNTTENTRRLPTTLQLLRAEWLPDQPETTVSRSKDGVRRLDAAIAAVRAQLQDRDQRDRDLAAELANAAIDGEDLEPHLARLGPGDAPVLESRLTRLQTARAHALRLYDRAQRNDEQHLEWQTECRRIEEDWQVVMAVDPERRVDALVEFSQRH